MGGVHGPTGYVFISFFRILFCAYGIKDLFRLCACIDICIEQSLSPGAPIRPTKFHSECINSGFHVHPHFFRYI